MKNDLTITEVAKGFEELPTNVIDEKVIQTLSLLPIEHLQGQNETILSLLVLSSAQHFSDSCAKKLLARIFFNGFRTLSILKYLGTPSTCI